MALSKPGRLRCVVAAFLPHQFWVVGLAVASNTVSVTPSERATLLTSVLIISICAITYELIVGTISSYLLGNSVAQFSYVIGLFLFAMGVGSLISRLIQHNEILWFIVIELTIAFFGGFSASVLYGVFALADVYYYLVMFILIMIIGICIGLEIPLLTRIVATRAELSKALADILSVDYLGALVASLAFPLVLLPALGATQTAYLMGLFNLCVAIVILNLFRKRLSKRRRIALWSMAGVFFVTLSGGLVTATSVFDFFEQQLYEYRIIYREQTPYQRIVITRRKDDIRLFLDGNLQFSSRDEYRYHELLVHPAMSAARSHERILVLGGGDGMVVRELLKHATVQEIVVVDLDPAVTDLAQSYPLLRNLNNDALANERVEIVNEDAFTYVQDGTERFGVIIIDLPDPNNEGLAKLYSQQFYRMLENRLTPDGVFATQATSPYFARQAFWCIAETIAASGYDIQPLHTYIPSFGDWGFVIAAPGRLVPLTIDTQLEQHYLTEPVLAAAHTFDPDIQPLDVEINTLDNPVLVEYYIADWQQWN